MLLFHMQLNALVHFDGVKQLSFLLLRTLGLNKLQDYFICYLWALYQSSEALYLLHYSQ